MADPAAPLAPAPVPRAALAGATSALAAVVCFSINDTSIKFLSGDYALHQIVLIRSSIAMLFFFAVIMPMSGGRRVLRTRRLGLHLVRGSAVVMANLAFFLGLASMPLADAVAIFFVAPLIITAFSVVFLGETVGPRRWAAVGIGLAGVMVMLRPGTDGIQWVALLPLAAAVAYATLHTLTRKLGVSESAATMTFYIQLVFIFASAAIGLALGDGAMARGADRGAWDFLFRAWVWPEPRDYAILALVGVCSALGGFFISQAYRLGEAAFVAPFEYVAMPMAVFWGVVVFGEWPDGVAWLGMALIVGAGLFVLWREAGTGAPLRLRHRR